MAASIICFGLLWAAVFLQMATGNDPVLSANSSVKATAARVTQPERRPAGRVATEAIETTKPRDREDESESDERPSESEVEAEPAPEPEPEPELVESEAVEEPEPELEPLTTGQS